jgi:hypothetical protein
MPVSLECLSVELFYEIFSYLQLHEFLPAFSNLNDRFTTILTHMSLDRVNIGINGMSMTTTQVYHRYLSEHQRCSRVNCLIVSNTMSIGNGTWLASHLHLFTGLHQLILVDIDRVDFESILNVLSCLRHLRRFDVKFTKYNGAASTYYDLPEGYYHERIFRSLPQLHICQLHFIPLTSSMVHPFQSNAILSTNSSFVPVNSMLARLQSLSLKTCTFHFLSHLVRHLPQLQVLAFRLCESWFSSQYPLMNDHIM